MKNKLFIICIFMMLIYCLSAVCASEINATSDDLTEIDDTNIKVSSPDTEVDSADESSENVKLSSTDDSNDNLTSNNEHTDISNTINDNKVFTHKDINIKLPKIPNAGIDICSPKKVVNINIEKSKDLDDLSIYLSTHNPSWGLLNITLATNTKFNVNNDGFKDYECSFKFRYWGSMIINGQGLTISGSKNFMFLTQNANLILNNVAFSGFDTVFFNFGHVFCYAIIFNKNNMVITNYNSVGFESCSFLSKNTKCIEAKEGSFNLIYDSCYPQPDKGFIKCEKNSIMTIYTPYTDTLKNNVNIDPTACFSIISTKQFQDALVINCSDINQFKNTLSSLNSFTPNVGRVEINLKPGIYELSSKDVVSICKNSP